ncbi:hypothetical protein [Microbispora sp. NPDC046933]|uniref:hypothetical protein n=1 Tax=Microbispora sp. NPDC046933 TaxID=3155618 RepID=UPI0033E8B5C3
MTETVKFGQGESLRRCEYDPRKHPRGQGGTGAGPGDGTGRHAVAVIIILTIAALPLD